MDSLEDRIKGELQCAFDTGGEETVGFFAVVISKNEDLSAKYVPTIVFLCDQAGEVNRQKISDKLFELFDEIKYVFLD